VRRDSGSGPDSSPCLPWVPSDGVAAVPVVARNVRWERPTVCAFWNALADPEREALAAAGSEELFRAGSVLYRAGDDSSQVMIIDSGWVKVSVRDGNDAGEKILAVRGQGDVVGERAALTTQVRSATVTALDEVSAMVVPADRFAEFLRGHPRAVEVLQRQVKERQEEDRARLFPGERAGAERRLAWLLFDLAQRRGGYRHTAAAFTLPMSQQELADWAGTTADAVGRFLRSWRERGIIVRGERSRRLTVVDLDGLAAICDQTPGATVALEEVTGEAAPATRWFGAPGEPLNCSILFTDVAGFGNPLRLDPDREVVRTALYEILRSSFEASGVPWADCYYEDRGDGAVIVVPPTISTLRVVDPLIPELAARLRQYNRRASEVVLIQLRAALHVGPVGKDAEGLTGQAVIGTARILDAPVVKERLADARADLIFAVSDYVYDHVVRHGAGRVDSGAFEHVAGQVKESHVSAWIHLAGRIELPPSPPRPGSWPGPLPVAPPLGKLPAAVRGRDGLLGELRRALRSYPWRASRTFVITGMGGLGKSTVALAAAKMAKDRGYRVWWLGATDTALLTSGMLEVLRELGAPESVIAPVREGARTAPARAWEFLNGEHAAGKRWLLIFDGADHSAVLAGADAMTPADGTGWLRADPAGMVIVTTRNRDPQVWGTGVTLRELKALDEEASAEVLRDLAPEVADPGGHQARELSRRLGGLPLALHLAGAYHEALDSVELPAALADIEGPGADVRADVQRTWDLSLDALAAEGRPQARMLLFVLSCFAPATPIPAWLLRSAPLADLLEREAGGTDKDAGWSRLRAGMQGLSHTGLIEISSGGGPAGLNAITVHPVVADANRSRLATIAATERRTVQNAAVALLEAAARRASH
jgi:CRP-like cAMP-binding protein